MNRTAILSMFIACMSLQAIAQTGSITNILVNQRTDGSGLLDVYFDLSGEFENFHIFLEASFDNGLTYLPLDPAFLQGDTGPLPSGTQYHIVWDGYASFPDTYSEEAKLKIMAVGVIGNWIPCPDLPFFTDARDGKVYNTTLIGDQCWMKENLNYYVDNSFCYDDTVAMCDIYGRLYTWDAAMATNDIRNDNITRMQGVCPAGWYLPGNADWDQLIDYLYDEHGIPNINMPQGAAIALRSCRQIDSPFGGMCNTQEHPRWEAYYSDGEGDDVFIDYYGIDEFGFSALPGGTLDPSGVFSMLGYGGVWWTSDENPPSQAWTRGISYGGGYLSAWDGSNKMNGFSVRCIRNND